MKTLVQNFRKIYKTVFELEVLEDFFFFSDKKSGPSQTASLGVKLYTVFFIAELV